MLVLHIMEVDDTHMSSKPLHCLQIMTQPWILSLAWHSLPWAFKTKLEGEKKLTFRSSTERAWFALRMAAILFFSGFSGFKSSGFKRTSSKGSIFLALVTPALGDWIWVVSCEGGTGNVDLTLPGGMFGRTTFLVGDCQDTFSFPWILNLPLCVGTRPA